MSTIVTRAGKGSPLTNNEVDANFTNLNTDKIETLTSADGSVTITPTGTTRDLSVGTAASTGNLIAQVRNETGATLTKGTVVYVSGAASNKALVSKALATSDATSAQTYGMIQADIPNNQNGYVVVIGSVTGLDTSAFANGTQLYLSGTTAGTYTSTKPYAPIHLVYVGIVTYSHATQGTIQVKIQNGYEMDELHNVSAQTPSNGNTLVYNTSTGLWEASSTLSGSYTLSAGTANGVTYLNGSKVLTSGSALTFDGSFYLGLTGAMKINSNGYKLRFYDATGATGYGYLYTDGTNFQFDSGNTQPLSFLINGSETMRLTSTSLYTASGINVGIGTSSPVDNGAGYKTLTINSTTSGVLEIQNNGTSRGQLFSDASNFIFNAKSASTGYKWNLAGTTSMVLDSAGNLGLGVTPSAWSSSWKALQVGSVGAVASSSSNVFMSNNYYLGATNDYYITTNYATRYKQVSGQHIWDIAPSGTGGTTISSFTQAMTLDASGNLGLGTTSPSSRLHTSVAGENVLTVQSTATTTGTTRLRLYSATATTPYDWYVQGDSASGTLRFYNAQVGSEAGRFDTSNNLLIGTTTNTNTSKLVVNGTISQTVGGTQYLVVDQSDIGTGANEIPLNQYLGSMAYQNANSVVSIGLGAGTAALPSLYSATNTSSGLWFPAANTIAASVNGAEGLRLTTTGLGIGTSSPAYKLDVNGNGNFSSLLTLAKGSSSGLTIGDVATNSNSVLRMQGTSAGYNWQIANNLNAAGLEFTPSTATGGTTYTTPSMTLTTTGLGIGTSLPLGKLDVRGTAYFNGTGATGGASQLIAAFAASGGSNFGQLINTNTTWSLGYGASYSSVGTSVLTWDASGNVGIGTSLPSTKLQVNFSSATAYSSGATGNGLTIYNTSATNGQYAGIFFQGEPTAGNAGQASIYGTTTGSGAMDLVFSTRGSSTLAERARLDSAGNLGLGVTPSAWNSAYKVLQFATTGALFAESGESAVYLASNSFINSAGTNKYITTDFATRYNQENGVHKWLIAASGNAGDTISFTTAMTLDASGKLGVGVTSPTSVLDVRYDAEAIFRLQRLTTTTGALFQQFNNGGGNYYIGPDSSAGNRGFSGGGGAPYGLVISAESAYPVCFGTNNLERARIDSSGNLGVGTTSPAYKLHVSGSAYVTSKLLLDTGSASAPPLTFYGWTNSGIYNPDGNSVAFTVNGTERGKFDSSGNLRLTNSNNIASITQTAITLTGASGSGTGGQTVNIITANSTTRGVLIVGSTQNCSAIFFINAGNAVNLSSQTTNETRFTATSGAANTANVYASGSNIVLQNNIQASRDFYVTFIGQV